MGKHGCIYIYVYNIYIYLGIPKAFFLPFSKKGAFFWKRQKVPFLGELQLWRHLHAMSCHASPRVVFALHGQHVWSKEACLAHGREGATPASLCVRALTHDMSCIWEFKHGTFAMPCHVWKPNHLPCDMCHD